MSRPRNARSTQAGYTVIEVVVAMMLSLLAVGAIAALLVHANDSSLGSQREVSMLSVAQQQIERVRQKVSQYGFSALALNAYPAAATDATLPANPLDPNDFITNNNTSSAALLIEQNYNHPSGGQISSAPANGEPLIIDAANGRVSPKQTLVAAGTGTATVYTYVTQATVGINASLTCSPSCANDARRVTVAVKLDQPSGRTDVGPNAPTYASTLLSSPVPSNQPNSADGLRIGLNIL